MKKRRPIFFAIFLTLGILIVVVHHCKAEGWNPNDGDPWTPPDWAESTFEPPVGSVPPSHPQPTPCPSQEDLRGASTAVPTDSVETPDPSYIPMEAVPDGAYLFDVTYRYGLYSFALNDSQSVGLSSSSGGNYYSGYALPWPFNTDTLLQNDYDLKSFRSFTGTNVAISSLPLRTHGVYLNMQLTPNYAFTCDHNLDINLQWKCTPALIYPTNQSDLAIFEQVMPSPMDLYDMGVRLFVRFTTSTNRYLYETFDYKFRDLDKIKFTLNLDFLQTGETLSDLRLALVINWFPLNNPVYYQFYNYYQQNNITPSYYPTWKFSPTGNCLIRVIPNEDQTVKKSWLKSLLDSLFKPSYQNIKDIIDDYVFDPSGTSTTADHILDFREVLYNLFLEDTEDAQIVIPSIDIPLPNNNTAHILDGYTFNLSQFYNGSASGGTPQRPPFATLISGVRTITSCLIGSLFFASLWEIFVTVFGLYKWSGVYSDTEDDDS